MTSRASFWKSPRARSMCGLARRAASSDSAQQTQWRSVTGKRSVRRSGATEPPRSCAWLMLTEALGPRGPPDNSDELPHHLLAVVVLDGVRDAALDAVLQEEERHLAGSAGHGRQLLDDVRTVAGL